MKRRTFLKAAAAGMAASTFPHRFAIGGRQSARPNILIILADDMGFSDIGCYGGEIHTPHLDGLAENALRFTQFYNAARCCPTRACLLTGLYPHQAGMGSMVSKEGEKPEGPYQGYLNDRCATLAEVLGPAGYRTYMSGKWHVGEQPEHWPRRRGFDRYFGLISGASSYYEIVEPERRMALDDAPFTPPADGFYMTDAFTDHAVRCIDEHEDPAQPFLHYLAFTAPHWPLHAPEENVARYSDRYSDGWDALRPERHARQKQLGVVDPRWTLSPRDDEVPAWEDRDPAIDWPRRMAVYAGMIDRMDQCIGRVLDALRAKGAFENTLVLFLSDNGGCHESGEKKGLHKEGTRAGERGSYLGYRRPWANASNTPFRMFKHWVHEGGIATPCIAHWPEGITDRGTLNGAVGHVVDIMPTCVELARTQYPSERNGKSIAPPEGRSLLPALTGGAWDNGRTIAWEHQRNRALRQGDWKLVSREEHKTWELYNVAEDRTELNNRADAEPARLATMQTGYEAWAKRCGVHMG